MIHIDRKQHLEYVLVRDERPQNTDSGTFQQGDWRPRALNTLVDPEGLASLSSDLLTLVSGLWECYVSCPAYQVDRHQARLWNDDDGVVLKDILGDDILGTSERANGGIFVTNRSVIQAVFRLPVDTTIGIQHQCSDTRLNDGFGDASNFSREVYTIGRFLRISI